MGKFFLVARNKRSNQFQILKLNDSWYLEETAATNKVTRDNDLEAIDLVTSCFDSRETLANRLYENNYIDDPNVDIFIASKRRKDGSTYIRFEEPIYAAGNSHRLNALRSIAKNSLNGDMNADRKAMNVVYDDIITRVYSSADFFGMVMDGETNISRRFAEQLAEIPKYGEIPFELKYDRYFRFGGYREARNVIEALNRLEGFSASSHDDRVAMNQEFIEDNYSDRLAIAPQLALELEKDYCDGQLSLFDFYDERDSQRIREATKRVVKEEKARIPERYRTPKIDLAKKKIPVEQMPQEIFRILDTIPTNVFRWNGEKWVFNEDTFKHPILDEERDMFNRLLTGNMPKFFINYAVHKEQLTMAREMGEYSEAEELREACDRDKSYIRKRFKSSKCIMDTYNWCMLYEGCMKRDLAYESSGMSVGSESADVKIFGKKQ